MAKYSEHELMEIRKRIETEMARIAEEKKQIHEQRSQLARESQEWAKQKNLGQSKAMDNPTSEQKVTGTVSGLWGTIGSMKEYTLNEDFDTWYELFQQYIAANNIQSNTEKSVSLFLTLMGFEGYKVL